MNILTPLVTAFLAASSLAQHPAMPAGMTHEQHLAQLKKEDDLKKRGAAAMGFDQEKTTHHFVLAADGGSIEVAANDTSDQDSRNQIRAHLKEIAAEFASGDFAKPLATHNELPPGVQAMQQRQKAIGYQYEETANGGRVRISTADRKAISAIHEFLRYQIREHTTGDPLK
jgi:hypothetical protein